MKKPKWLGIALVRAMHSELISEHGGKHGERDAGLLESALARAPNAWGHGERRLARLAACYGFGIAKNHTFLDGNKRVALASIDVFLRLNGRKLTASEESAAAHLLDLASGRIDEGTLGTWIAAESGPLDDGRSS